MKILCICNFGNVRSVAMAQFIKNMNGKHRDFREANLKYEAIAVGKMITSKETMKMLKNWADKVIDLSDRGEHSIGHDKWHNPKHPELILKMEELWFELNAKRNT